MLPVIQGVTLATIAVSLTAYLTNAVTFPRSSPIIFWFIAILMVGGGRIVVRAYFYGLFNNYLVRENVAKNLIHRRIRAQKSDYFLEKIASR